MTRMFAAVLVAGIGLSAAMALVWRLQRITGRSSHVDTFWSVSVGVAGFGVAMIPFDAVPWRQSVVAIMVLVWGLRLGVHIARRNHSADDDPRYRRLQQDWGATASVRMFRFLQSQAVVGTILVLAVALAAHNRAPMLRFQDIAGFAVLVLALAGEALADHQLRRFARTHRGAVCNSGLWAWSRHPNYFFEWLAWCAYPLIAGGGWGLLALAAPVVMYWTLAHVSGIPPLEDHMLLTRGMLYRKYQKTTSPFFPRPPHR